jgi:hypothetical protein
MQSSSLILILDFNRAKTGASLNFKLDLTSLHIGPWLECRVLAKDLSLISNEQKEEHN